MNKGMKRFLAVAACIAIVGNTGISAFSETVSIGPNSTANANAGSLSNTTDGTTTEHVWQHGATGSVSVNLSGGTLDVSNYNDTILNDTIDATSGNLNINNGTFAVDSSSSISSGVSTNIGSNSIFAVIGGEATLDTNDTWNGYVGIESGDLLLNNTTKNSTATFTQIGGDTTVIGRNFNLNNESDAVLGGTLTIGNGVNSSKLTISQGAVADTSITVEERSNLDITGGYVDIGSTSNWKGTINVSGGEVTIDNVIKTAGANFSQTNGKTTITGTGFDLGNGDDIVSGGTFNIGNKTTTTEVSVSQGYIESSATVNINRNGKLNVSGGEVNLDAGDSWTGDLNVTDGTLTVSDLNKKSSAKFTQSGGETTITTDTFNFNNSSDKVSGGKLNITSGTTLNIEQGSIESGAVVKLDNNTTTNISGGSLALDNTDTWNGNVNVTGGSLALVGITNKNGTFTQTKGTTTVTETGFDLNNRNDSITGGTLNIGDGTTTSSMNVSAGTIGGNTKVDIKNAGSLNVSGGSVSLGESTTWNGAVNVSNGTLDINSATKTTSGIFSQSNGTTTVVAPHYPLLSSRRKLPSGATA